MATKSDIAELRAELKGDIAGLRAELYEVRNELKSDIHDLRREIANIHSELEVLTETVESHGGYAKELDSVVTRLTKIESHPNLAFA